MQIYNKKKQESALCIEHLANFIKKTIQINKTMYLKSHFDV